MTARPASRTLAAEVLMESSCCSFAAIIPLLVAGVPLVRAWLRVR